MLAFVTSLRHPQNSADYRTVEALLERTLASVCAQTDRDFVVIVVGNRAPTFTLPPQTLFVEVDFPAPAPPSGPMTPRDTFVWDKGTKIGIGLIAASRFAPSHAMIFDADDFVSRRLSAFVSEGPPAQGWYVDTGWAYSRSRNAYQEQKNFHRACGTSLIVPFDAYDVPSALTTGASQAEVSSGFGDHLPNVLGAHRDAVNWFTKKGVSMKPLPFPGAVYHVDTGENHSGKSMQGRANPIDSHFTEEFAVTGDRSAIATWWSARGPRAQAESAARLVRRTIRK